MASPRNRTPARRPAPPAPTPPRAQPVARPAIPPATRLAAMTGDQVIEQIRRHTAASLGETYGLGLCLQELSRPNRYADELGFGTFEELLAARQLPSRMTAHKLITVVSTFSEREVRQLGTVEKCFEIVRFFKKQDPNADPRKALAPNARVLGRAVADVSAADLNRALREDAASEEENEAALRASARLGEALRRAEIECRMRTHAHGSLCVSVHLSPEDAIELAKLLARLRKLEKQLAK